MVGPQGKCLLGKGGVRRSGEKLLMQNCGPAPGGPQILAQAGTWTSCTIVEALQLLGGRIRKGLRAGGDGGGLGAGYTLLE